MRRVLHDRQGFGLVGILLIVCIGLLAVGGGLYVWRQHNDTGDMQPSTTGGIKLSGTISSDTCSPDYNQIPDTGCSIVVKGYSVEIEAGFSARPFLGKVTGLDAKSLKGRRADIYAENDDSKTLDISSSSKYYVHIH